MLKKEGFKGQRTVVLPKFIINEIEDDSVRRLLYLTDVGFYPQAQFHYRKREKGCCQFILIYCIEGEGWISVNGKKNIVYPNQYFIIPPDVAHAYGCSDKNPWSIYWVHFSGELAPQFYDSSGSTQTIAPFKIDRIDDRIRLFGEIMQNLEMGYCRENLDYANICLGHFLASFKYIRQFRQIRKISGSDFVGDAILFMKENIGRKLSLNDLAAETGLSASHFSLVFRTKTGRSPIDYLTHLRIQEACRWLDHSDLRINQIAGKIGYDDSYYFSRTFKKVMGISPAAYRKQPKG